MLLLEILSTIIAAFSMAYISMAISVGPWISPAIILIGNLLFFKIRWLQENNSRKKFLLHLQQAPAFAGLVATAVGFNLPALYFLDKSAFESVTGSFYDFLVYTILGVLLAIVVGSACGVMIYKYINSDERYTFPFQNLISNHIENVNQKDQSTFAIFTFGSSIFCFLRDYFSLSIKKIGLISPSLSAIGFLIGQSLIVPLSLGIALCFLPNLATALSLGNFFNHQQFGFEIASGLMVFDFFFSLYLSANCKDFEHIVAILKKRKKRIIFGASMMFLLGLFHFFGKHLAYFQDHSFVGIFSYYTLFAAIMAMLLFISLLEIAKFSAKAGLAPLGRFTSFVMIPLWILFQPGPKTLIWICLFTATACATVVQLLFQTKIAELSAEQEQQIIRRHFWSIPFVFICVAVAFYFFLSFLTLGSSRLFSMRGQMKAALLNIDSINPVFVGIGAVIAMICKFFKISEMFLLTGIVMPMPMSLSMLAGACMNYFKSKNNQTEAASSGILVGESLAVIAYLLMQIF